MKIRELFKLCREYYGEETRFTVTVDLHSQPEGMDIEWWFHVPQEQVRKFGSYKSFEGYVLREIGRLPVCDEDQIEEQLGGLDECR